MNTAIFEIFRAGKHNSVSEQGKRFWTAEQIEQICRFYSENIKVAPLVIGHPDNDEPQFGKVQRLIHHNSALFAEAEIESSLVKRIKQGEISGISASFYTPNSQDNPIQQLGYYLKHVGFLEKGVQSPAVSGMLSPEISVEYLSYSEYSADVVLFCEEEKQLSYAQQIHEKTLYFQKVLDVDYKTALCFAN